MNIKEAEEYLIDRYGIKWKDYITSELDTMFLKMIAEDFESMEDALHDVTHYDDMEMCRGDID